MNETVAASSVKLPVDMACLEPLTGFVAGVCRLAGCDGKVWLPLRLRRAHSL